MTKTLIAAAILILTSATGALSRAADEPAKPATDAAQKPAAAAEAQEAAARDASSAAAVIDKAVEALGGKDTIAAAKVITWSSKGTISLGGTDGAFTAKLVYQGFDHRRIEFDADLAGNAVKAVVVVNGDKGWRRINDSTSDMGDDELANERRTGYREWTSATVLPLKSPPFKTEPAGQDTVNGKPASGVKVTGPDGKTFTLYFDKEGGLPVKQTATVPTFTGAEANEETTYSDYKDFGGVKKATRVEVKHDGQKLLQAEVTEFKVLDAAEAGAFDRPE